MIRLRKAFALVAILFWSSGCGGPDVETGLTGIDLRVTYDVELNQLSILVSDEEMGLLGPKSIPEPPRALSPEGESVMVVLPEELGAVEITIRVVGFLMGETRAVGQRVEGLWLGEFRVVEMHLREPELCGGTVCEIGQHCVENDCVCDRESCSSGCCDENGRCQPGNTTEVCGGGGGSCEVCPVRDECESGSCSGCVASCPGCCSGATCNDPVPVSTCGTDGQTCVTCDSLKADGCSPSGECQCGGSESCRPGLHCVNGVCVCNEEACPIGCCLGGVCHSGEGDSACGSGGVTCADCSADHATGVCEIGACVMTCDANWGDCNSSPDDGCETDLLTTDAHCGSCVDPCPFPTTSCDAGSCVCPSGCSPCSGGCDLCLCSDGCPCEMECADNCDIVCLGAGTVCHVAASEISDINFFQCGSGAWCLVDFTNSSNMETDAICSDDGTLCEINCAGSSNCRIECLEGAECILHCGELDFSHCELLNCSSGVVDCGTDRICNSDFCS